MIPFTRYARGGKRVEDGVVRSEHIERLARELFEAGFRFEAEVLSTGEVHMDCTLGDDSPIAIEVVPNGPEVPIAVDRLVLRAHERWAKRGNDQ